MFTPSWRHRRDGGMAKGAVRLARHAGEIARTDRIADETPDHVDGDFGIRPAAKPAIVGGSSRGQLSGT